jgi:hypothetical protein
VSDGPSPESLRRMAQMLPSITAGIKERRIGGKGVSLVPTCTCDICGKAHNYVSTAKSVPLPQSKTCNECLEEFKAGTCLKSKDGRFAFVTSPKLPLGKTIEVTNEEMTRVQDRHKHDLHVDDVRRILTPLGCLDADGLVVEWKEEAWSLLEEAGHDAFEAKSCKCRNA